MRLYLPYLLASFFFTGALRAATFTFVFVDPPNFGFNDTTPVTPLPDNKGTSLGEQRRNVLQQAADTFGQYIESSVVIQLEAEFIALGGTPTNATLASAGPYFFGTSTTAFDSNLEPNTWYPQALGESLIGYDRDSSLPDVFVTVNESVDSDPAVLGGVGFYYGYDHNFGTKVDLYATLLHEIGHGLGMSSLVNKETGETPSGLFDVFTKMIRDQATGKLWTEMTDSERQASVTNDPNLVFVGPAVNGASQRLLKPPLDLLSPDAEVRVLLAEEPPLVLNAVQADFGLRYPPWGMEGAVVLVDDGIAPTIDGCETPFVNAEAIRGKIALIDRGSCNFTVKIKHAQDAGATGVIMVNNQGDDLVTMSGNDNEVRIPSVFISETDGDTLKAIVSSTELIVSVQTSGELSGTSGGAVRLFAPAELVGGSSVSHFSTDTSPALLMQPFIPDTFLPELDLTIPLMRDIGWKIKNYDIPFFTYDLWAAETMTGAGALAAEDTDEDGWNNFTEYAFGTDAEDPSDQPVGVRFELTSELGSYAIFYTRNQLAADVVFGVSDTSELLTPFESSQNGADFIPYSVEDLGEGLEAVQLRIRTDESQRFFRVTAEEYVPD